MKPLGGVGVVQPFQLLKVVVGHGLAVLVHVAPEDGVGKGIAGGIHLPAPVDEGVGVLGGHDGIEHDSNT